MDLVIIKGLRTGRVVGVVGAVIRVANGTAIGTTSNTAVGIADRIGGVASSGVRDAYMANNSLTSTS